METFIVKIHQHVWLNDTCDSFGATYLKRLAPCELQVNPVKNKLSFDRYMCRGIKYRYRAAYRTEHAEGYLEVNTLFSSP